MYYSPKQPNEITPLERVIQIACLVILLLFLFSKGLKAQECWLNKGNSGSVIKAGVLVDWSAKPIGVNQFIGTGVHAGIWADGIGLFVGYVESKLNDSTKATRDGAVTLAGRFFLMDDKIQLSPFFSAGTQNYCDIGLRAGYKINDGLYIGAMGSRMMHYGLSVMVCIF